MSVLGVIGTMVWDTIWRDSDTMSPIEEWGGISYALAAADAACPPGYGVRPIIKLGRDLAESGLRFIRALSVIESDAAISVVDAPNTRVELSYRSNERRCERISGHLSEWTWAELEPRVRGCDALYVNFITGNELDLGLATLLRRNFEGAIYADIHSLLLATGPGGERHSRPLDRWAEWLTCFDAVQLNEDELTTLSAHWGDPWAFAADIVGRDTRLLFVTLGTRGAAYVATPDALPLRADGGRGGRGGRGLIDRAEPVRTGHFGGEPVQGGDPTGCGDVWGMTAFCKLLEGCGVEEVVRAANEAASRNVAHLGATGLNGFLKGRLGRA
ncbi:MAG: carbohydrate kinase family protein [Gemmatimonadota bacterium]